MECINIRKITKSYDTFSLNKISMSLPNGASLVVLGGKGSGKTTFFKCLLGLTSVESGHISYYSGLGLTRFLEESAVVLGTSPLPLTVTPLQVQRFFSPQYQHWDKEIFREVLAQLEIPLNEKLETKQKARECLFACGLSHKPDILMVDRPCYQELFPEEELEHQSHRKTKEEEERWKQGEQNCLALLPHFFTGRTQIHSRHSVEELPSAVSHLAFLKQGELVLYGERKLLLENCATVTCDLDAFKTIETQDYIRALEIEEGFLVLIADRFDFFMKYSQFPLENVTISEIDRLIQEGTIYPWDNESQEKGKQYD